MNLDSKAAVNTHLNYFYSTNTQNENTTLVIHHQFQTRYRKSHSITTLLIRFGTVHENKKKAEKSHSTLSPFKVSNRKTRAESMDLFPVYFCWFQ